MREPAEAADKAKSDLLAMVGHELRAPMEAVVAMIELLMASPLDPTQARYTEMLYQSARACSACSTTCSTSRGSKPARFELDRASFDLHELIHDVGSVLQARASEKGLTGGVDIGANCPRSSSAMRRGSAKC